MPDRTGFSSNTVVSWIVLAFGTVILGVLAYLGNNTADIPVIKAKVEQQQVAITGMQAQTSDVPLIKLQMDYITKQLEHINSSEDVMSHTVEENRNKIADHERRIQALENAQ